MYYDQTSPGASFLCCHASLFAVCVGLNAMPIVNLSELFPELTSAHMGVMGVEAKEEAWIGS